MNFTQRLTPKTWYLFFVIVWFLISIHVGYLYISFSSDETPGKGGTFIEATIASANYLPYSSADDNDKFYQSLLYNGCLYPTIEGTDIVYREELCTVSTDNYQVFTVSVTPGQYRSDGTEVTLNDIYFTYKTLITDNYRNLPFLDNFRNMIVTADTETETITVTFPSPSIDNMIFFTNFILPAHRVANESYETYLTQFLTNPTNSTCVRLQQGVTNRNNTVFDLGACENTLLRYYQVRTFNSQQEADQYIAENPSVIDLVLSDQPFDGYVENNVILNRYITFFFNTKSGKVNAPMRSNLVKLIKGIATELNDETIFVGDSYLFDAIEPSTNTDWVSALDSIVTEPSIQEETVAVTLPPIPVQIVWGADNQDDQNTFFIEGEIEDRETLQLVFTDAFDQISVTANDGVEYFPSSFNKLAQSAVYNVSPLFRNIQQGRNIYTIKGYIGDTHTQTYSFILHYLEAPTTTVVATSTPNDEQQRPIEIIYYTNPVSQAMIEKLSGFFEQNDIDQYFSIQGFADSNTFEGKIMSGDFDIVLRSINIGLRKDISNLFTSDISTINPSGYTNPRLAELINRFFLAPDNQKATIKAQIDEIYTADVPLAIVGKELGTVAIRDALEFTYPQRVYVLGRRRDFIDQINIFNHVDINWDKVFLLDNFFAFIGEHL